MSFLNIENRSGLHFIAACKLFKHCVIVCGIVTGNMSNLDHRVKVCDTRVELCAYLMYNTQTLTNLV